MRDKIVAMLTTEFEFTIRDISEDRLLELLRNLAAKSGAFDELLATAGTVGDVTIAHGGAKGCRCMCCTEFTISTLKGEFKDHKWVETPIELDRAEWYDLKDVQRLTAALEAAQKGT